MCSISRTKLAQGVFPLTVGLLVIGSVLSAQVAEPSLPFSFINHLDSAVDTVTTPPFDAGDLRADDDGALRDGLGVPFRFGHPFSVAWGLDNVGTWDTLEDGGRVWRLRIESPRAYSLNLIYDTFWLPEGAQLWLYSPEGSLLGAFTARNNKVHGQFATGLTSGDTCIVEYYEPAEVREHGQVEIGSVIHGYKKILWDGFKGFGHSGACNVNVRCSEGGGWDDQIRAVGMILVGNGSTLCSGVLLNNVRQDMTPYFLTANHCAIGNPGTWVVTFNYESPLCANENSSMSDTVTGMTLRASNDVTDFALLELSAPPPSDYNVYYAGWSAAEEAAGATTCIHHPRGDVKKISFDYHPVVSSHYPWDPGDVQAHWKVVDWDVGTTEPGSSGSALFDENHRIVGQLTGGEAACGNDLPDYFGKLSLSWDGGDTPDTRLRDWLDPDDSGRITLDGLDANDAPPEVEITSPADGSSVFGIVSVGATASDDRGIDHVDFFVDTVLEFTDTEAPYTYQWDARDLPRGQYVLKVAAFDTVGLSSTDSVVVFKGTRSLWIGDANCDSQVDVADAVCILAYLLGSRDDPCKTPCCRANEDTNNDDAIDIADAITLLSYLFAGDHLLGPDGAVIGSGAASCTEYDPSVAVLPCENSCD